MNFRNEETRKKIHAIFILDESGSMNSCKEATLVGINEQIQEMKKVKDVDTNVTLVTFSGPSSINRRLVNVPVSEIKELDDNNYNPCGGTALLDTIHQTVSSIKNLDEPNTSYLVYIITDGEENSSVEFSCISGGYKKIADLINECKSTNKWTFTYMGANQDLSEVKENLGIDPGNMLQYSSTLGGTAKGFSLMREGTAAYMATAASSTGSPILASNCFYSSSIGPILDADSILVHNPNQADGK